MEGLKISINNLTDLTWYRNNWHVGAGSTEGLNWPDAFAKEPDETILPHKTTEVIVEPRWFKDIVHDALWVILGYGNSAAGDFAIKLEQHFHLFSAGSGATWQVWDKEWKNLGDNASKHEWVFPHVRIVAVPTLSDPGGEVSVIINATK